MDITYIVVVVAIILVSMTVHEAMHAFVGYWLGDDTAKREGRLTLNPIKHIDPFLTILLPVILAILGGPIFGGAKPVPFNPDRVRGGEWGAALIAVAGPLINFLLAFICFGLWVLFRGVPEVSYVLNIAVLVNLGFFIFNMLPIPPLDGSRVLYALAPEFVRRGMEVIERMGLLVIFAIVLLGSSVLGTLMVKVSSAILWLFSRVFGVA